ncbi:M24 family metallopeptidase [Pusillimonas sp. TS35]|nr:M24 family metallopeptidase [Pusillimonas sp. TS35]
MNAALRMFAPHVYSARRCALCERVRTGLILLPGHADSPMNFTANPYPFRQDSTCLYFIGINRPAGAGLAAVIDTETGHTLLFGEDDTPEQKLWHGEAPPIAELAQQAGCEGVRAFSTLADYLASRQTQGHTVHFVPPCRAHTALLLAGLLDLPAHQIAHHASEPLIQAVVALREIKEDSEINQICDALSVARKMHIAAMQAARPGIREADLVAEMRRVLCRAGMHEAYACITTRRGDILHNNDYGGQLKAGDIVLNDAGAATAMGYASDVTRCFPASGRFDTRQRELYDIVLDAQAACIQAMAPGVVYANIHRLAAHRIATGLASLGIFRGNADEIVETGAYAICFPHGVGHQLGLDVHDMESLGEDRVGYDARHIRSQQPGATRLRLGKPLQRNMVVTVEPGVYFPEHLIRQWQAEQRHSQLIDYQRLQSFVGLGGIRLEDVVLVTDSSACVLGPAIPKHPNEVLEIMRTG